MKLHEVLQDESVLNGDMWFRPVSWMGCMSAYCVNGLITYRVPSLRGGERSMSADVEFLSGDWEIISAQDVLDGK